MALTFIKCRGFNTPMPQRSPVLRWGFRPQLKTPLLPTAYCLLQDFKAQALPSKLVNHQTQALLLPTLINGNLDRKFCSFINR
jgi:hypothetical protein